MNKAIPRLRMFAGPNGSGKSTIKSLISPELLVIPMKLKVISERIKFLIYRNIPSKQMQQKYWISLLTLLC